MPRTAAHSLTYNQHYTRYDLSTSGQFLRSFTPGDEEQWKSWLFAQSAFSLQGRAGHLNMLKEARPRGEGYWYAYYYTGQRTIKRYLGRTATVTLARLEEMAQSLTQQYPSDRALPPQTGTKEPSQAAMLSLQEGSKSMEERSSSFSTLQMGQFDPKFRLPRLPASLVERTHLLDLLNAGFTRKLTLISAPAGFGKTTLTRAWLASRTDTDMHELPVAWVALDEDDNDPLHFWEAVLAVCQNWYAQRANSTIELLRTAQHQAMLASFLGDLTSLTTRGVLVLEDYHVITSPHVHEMLAWLIARLPETLHLIVITRIDPPLALARLRANGEMQEVRAADLAFSLAETQAFLQQTFLFPLDGVASTRMHLLTEGWITGLRLLTLTLQPYRSQQEIEPHLASFRGTHRYVLEYLVEDVLAAQPDHIQLFLLQTSGLHRLTAPLCHVVTGRADTDDLLEQVERANLFLQPLDGTQQWYRYHALWASAIQREARRRLGESEVQRLVARASCWYEEHGFLSDAVEAALQAHDFVHAAALIERAFVPQNFHKAYLILRRWLELLPEEALNAHPLLSFAYAEALTFTSQRRDPSTSARAIQLLKVAERAFRAEKDESRLAQLLSLRATLAVFQNDLLTAFALAHEMLEVQPKGEQHWRGSSLLLIGEEALFAGKLSSVRQHTEEARVAYEADQSLPGLLAVAVVLGEVSLGEGAIREATLHYRRVLSQPDILGEELAQKQLTAENGVKESLFARWALHGLAQASYERNDLDTANQLLAQARTLGGSQVEELHYLTSGELLQARILHARGQFSQAQDLLDLLATGASSLLFLREVRACQARLALAAGDLAAVESWTTKTSKLSGTALFRIRQEEEALILARSLIVQREGKQALHILSPWQAEAEEQQRTRSLWEIQLLEALAHFVEDQLPEAKQLVLRVLTQAKVEGYQRLFLDEGRDMEALLKALLPETHNLSLASYIRILLHAFTRRHDGLHADSSQPTLLFEPLSPQEQRVLRLLVVGQTYAEIAQELIVSPSTIKTQVSSIYRKLGVNRRAEVVALAQHFNLP